VSCECSGWLSSCGATSCCLDESIVVGCKVIGAVVGFKLSDGAAIRAGKLGSWLWSGGGR